MLRGLAIIVLSFSWAHSAMSADCPPIIAAISDAELNAVIIPKTEALYRQLGCELKLTKLPGRRGIVEFNSGRVDGELFRIPIIEKLYQVPFVRSQFPLLEVQQGVWIKAGRTLKQRSLIGYVIGRRWQEEFAEDHHDKYRFVKYSGTAEMRTDYRVGRLDGFLSSSPTIETLMESNKLSELPELALKTKVVSLHHYVHETYEPFMAKFNKLLELCATDCQKSGNCQNSTCPTN
ncbi:ABC transporter substrate-binding protein [Labrenzia sp. PHM005]|uniref:ABC transporter substrate-binding protein n=1 Tax=Labrenzia sp. PHM005 TaxID=2590016 RepID=UPI00113FC8C4|nr:ABC transporter substrate-binding protein [Labrenzia sp. PHM005]QDG75887.1 ABC transporter substrate-binding protein [Labrenzia sp. PHM005]